MEKNKNFFSRLFSKREKKPDYRTEKEKEIDSFQIPLLVLAVFIAAALALFSNAFTQ